MRESLIDLTLLLRVRLRGGANAVRFASPRQRFIGGVLLVGGAGLFLILLVAFGLLLHATAQARPILLRPLINQSTQYVLLLLTASAVPFVSGTLFTPGDFSLLLGTPVRPAALVAARLTDAAVIASAQFVVIGVPLLLASAWGLNVPLVFAPLVLLLILAFLALPPLVVAVVLLLFTRLFGLRRVREAVGFVSAALAVGLCLLLVADFTRRADHSGNIIAAALRGESPTVVALAPRGMPSSWLTDALAGLGQRNAAAFAPPAALLLGATLLFFLLAVRLGIPTLTGETLLEAEGNSGGGASWADKMARLYPVSRPVRALIAKDLRFITRDLILLSQLGVPLILFFVPFVIAAQLHTGGSDLFLFCAAVIGTIVYMETSILGLSSIGLEGPAFWIALASPLTAVDFVRAKWWLSFSVFAALCLPLLPIAGIIFRAPPLWWLGGTVVLTIAGAALCGIGVGIAGVFPRFHFDNPAHRASLSALIWGFVAATLYALLSGIFLGGAAFLSAVNPQRAVPALVLGLGLFLLLSALSGAVPLLLAVRHLSGYSWESTS